MSQHHTMSLSPVPYEQIENGSKTIEVRLCDEKRQKIKVGDTIVFTNSEEPSRTVTTSVVELYRKPDFKSLYNLFAPQEFGGETKEALLKQIRDFYSPPDEKKFGVLGIRIKALSLITPPSPLLS